MDDGTQNVVHASPSITHQHVRPHDQRPGDRHTLALAAGQVARAARRHLGLEALVKLLVLASRHVHELLTYRECAEVMRAALAARARGQIQQPLRTIVRPPIVGTSTSLP